MIALYLKEKYNIPKREVRLFYFYNGLHSKPISEIFLRNYEKIDKLFLNSS